MIRRIVCEDCLTPQQAASLTPSAMTVTLCCAGFLVSLPSIVCDGCNKSLQDGSVAFAVTEWQQSLEDEPLNWEQEYSQ